MVVKKTKKADEPTKPTIRALLSDAQVLLENNDAARDLYNASRFGELDPNGNVQLSLVEALYLVEKEKIAVQKTKQKAYTYAEFLKKVKKLQPGLWTRYVVFRDMRNRGYIVKTALKFGADFRVYDRGVKPGDDHARWVLFPIHESQALTWHDFAAKNRVAHSTKKRLLIGIVDEENDVTYYEVEWKRP
jgi:tRNA-intron endonuclease, archaea type